MPRPKRIFERNAIYHVYNRANNKRGINLTNTTFDYFCSMLSELKKKYEIEIYAYCLMTNHYHLLIKTLQPNLDKFMKEFGQQYAQHINKLLNSDGPVFVSRYKAKLIHDDAYLLQVFRYIHLNPVEANLVEHFYDYPWSSATHYLNTTKTFVDKNFIKKRFMHTKDFIDFVSYRPQAVNVSNFKIWKL